MCAQGCYIKAIPFLSYQRKPLLPTSWELKILDGQESGPGAKCLVFGKCPTTLSEGFLGVPLSKHISVLTFLPGQEVEAAMGGVSVPSCSFLGHSIFLCLVPG